MVESYIKSISIESQDGNSFNTIMDTRMSLHYLSVYNAPFDQVCHILSEINILSFFNIFQASNIGMTWKYRISRLPSQSMQNQHIVQVTSGTDKRDIGVNIWTNIDSYLTSYTTPIILYANVRLGSVPVLNAKVLCEIQYLDKSGSTQHHTVQLKDRGNGDPDIEGNDGIYSKYLTWIPGPGHYSVSVQVVSEKEDQAFVFDMSSNTTMGKEELGHFSRIVKGNLMKIDKMNKTVSDILPPARILDLSVEVLTSSQQLEFRWTAPGDDFDEGKPSSYQLFESKDSKKFYKMNKSSVILVESFSGVQKAGGSESHKVSVQSFNQNLFYVMLAMDNEGNVGDMSNVVKAYMPRPLVIGQPGSNNTPLREGLFDPLRTPSQPNIVIMYVIVGIVSVVIFTFLVIVLVIIVLRKKSSCDSVMNSMDTREHHSALQKKEFPEQGGGKGEWDGNLLVNQLNIYNSLQRLQKKNIEHTSATMRGDCRYNMNITDLNMDNPNLDIFDYLPSTREAHKHEDTYIKGYQPSPTYAKPVPKSMRAGIKKDKSEKEVKISENYTEYSDGSLVKLQREEGDGESAEGGHNEHFYSGSVTQIESEYGRISTLKKVPPPTLPKPVTEPSQPCHLVTTLDIVPHPPITQSEVDKRVRNCTTV